MKKLIQTRLLPTEDNSGIMLGKSKEGILIQYNTEHNIIKNDMYNENQHIYFLSSISDGLYVGDFVIDHKNNISKVTSIDFNGNNKIYNVNVLSLKDNSEYNTYSCEKIIATTNQSLNLYCFNCNHKKQISTGLCTECGRFGDIKKFIPNITQDSIKNYLKRYNENKFNIIYVYVDYEYDFNNNIILKVNPNNEVDGWVVKENYSRSEVALLLHTFNNSFKEFRQKYVGNDLELVEEWIKENLI
jgi:hypothetical protein